MSRIEGRRDAAASPVAAHIPDGMGESISLNDAERSRLLALEEVRLRPWLELPEVPVRASGAGMGSGEAVRGNGSVVMASGRFVGSAIVDV